MNKDMPGKGGVAVAKVRMPSDKYCAVVNKLKVLSSVESMNT